MKPFGLYVHIPYCVQKCPYCDFNSYGVGLTGAATYEDEYISALVTEVQRYAARDEWIGRPVQSIFFGGGTPSLFTPASYARLFQAIQTAFPLQSDLEITLEANPGTVQEEVGLQKLSGFRAVGFNRVSFGSQSFQATKLRFLGRLHSPDDVVAAVDLARRAQFENINCDLIFGVEDESEDEWEDDLARVLALSLPHISAYTLTIERGTAFERQWRSGAKLVADEELVAAFYRHTQARLASAGYAQYEVSNYCLPDRECRHNRSYWRREDYLGLGAGAHSFSDQDESGYGRRWCNVPAPSDYVRRLSGGEDPVSREESLTQEQAVLEFFFLRVRFSGGFTFAELESKFDLSRDRIEARLRPVIARLTAEQILEVTHDRIRLQPTSYLFADSVVAALGDCI